MIRGVREVLAVCCACDYHQPSTEAIYEGGSPVTKDVIAGLYASPPEPPGFGPSLEICAFFLQRERGNLLVYRSEILERGAEEINAVGGISGQYLNHCHEASPAYDLVANTFGAPLHVHEEEAPSVSETYNVAATFSERHRLGNG